MLEAGVPCIAGYQGSAQDDTTLQQQAERIGYPLMIKASAGGAVAACAWCTTQKTC